MKNINQRNKQENQLEKMKNESKISKKNDNNYSYLYLRMLLLT